MIILFFLAPVFGLLWLLSLVLFLVGKAKKSQVVSWLGGLPLGALTLGAVAAVVLMFLPSNPADVYRESFGTLPPSDVTQLQGSDSSWGDSGVAFLKFNAAPSTIQRITTKGWKHLSQSEAQSETIASFQNEDTPSWWSPTTTQSSVIYRASKRLGGFSSSEEEVLLYDKATGQAYYSYLGID